MFGNNIIAKALDNPAKYLKARHTTVGGNPLKGVAGKDTKKSKAPKIKVRKAR